MKESLLQRLKDIGRSLEQTGLALALIGLGSVGTELERLDDFSDLDFFVIVKDGQKNHFLTDLSWLTKLKAVAYFFQNTEDGFKLLFKDNVFCEFAVFELHELTTIPFSAGRIIWKADGVPDEIAIPTRVSSSQKHSLEWNLGECLTNVYIGMKRYARGEKLSAARFVQQYAVDRLLELNELLAQPTNELADPFNRERRIEQRYPNIKGMLELWVQGYENTPESALAILVWLEDKFEVNADIVQAIHQEIDRVRDDKN
jgi:lincosamide nucleotidyltransferase B/F